MTFPTGEASDRGFTLLEVLIAVAILGMIAHLLSGVVRSTSATDIKNAASEIRKVLTLSRNNALRSGRNAYVSVDIARGEVQGAKGQPSAKIPDAIRLAFVGAQRAITSGDRATVAFYPDGTSSGGDVILSYRGRQEVTIRTEWLTGLVSVIQEDGSRGPTL